MPLIGKLMITIGLSIAFIGVLIWLFGNKFNWFGNLPGDIRIERQNFKFYAPLVSMLLLSVLLSGILWLIRKFF